MILITDKEIFSDSGKFIHRIGTDIYFKRSTKLPTDTESMFEEVDEIPEPPTEEDLAFQDETKKKVREMFFTASIPATINTFGLSPKEALSVKDYFPEWKTDIDVNTGDRYQCNDLLYECLQAHKTQDNWKPGIDTSSLWKVVEVEHEGTLDDPIPYTPPMELFAGKYYKQSGATYHCIRNSDIPLSHNLPELVGNYVEIV